MTTRFTALLLTVAACSSAEVMRRDVQLSVAASDPAFNYNIVSGAGAFSGEDQFDRSLELRLGGRLSLAKPGWQVAPLVGLDVVMLDAPYGDGGLSGYGLDASLGVAWAPMDRWQFELEATYGLMPADLVLPAVTSGGGLTGTGDITRQRLQVRGMRSIGRLWWVITELGWGSWSSDFEADRGRTVTLDGSSWNFAVGLAWRPTSRPEGLE